MKKRKKHRFRIILFLLVIAILFSLAKPLSTLVGKILYPLRYEEYIEKYSNEYGLDKYLVMAIIKAESNFISDAHSGIAKGLMQLTDETSLWIADEMNIDFSLKDLENPEINIMMGCYYLDYLLDNYDGDVTLSLAAYNAGMGNVNKWLKNPDCSNDGKSLYNIPFKETKKYIDKINKSIIIYEKLY